MIPGQRLQRLIVGDAGVGGPPRLREHVPELDQAPRQILRRGTARGDCHGHPVQGLLGVAGNEAMVGDAVITGQVGSESQHTLVRIARGVVLPHFHQGIAEQPQGSGVAGIPFEQVGREFRGAREVMTMRFDFRAEPDAVVVPGIGSQHLLNDGGSTVEVSEIGGLTHFLDECGGQAGLRVRIVGCCLERFLKEDDPFVGAHVRGLRFASFSKNHRQAETTNESEGFHD